MNKLLIFLLFLACLFSVGQATDASIVINAGIKSAILTGQKSYTIPAGTYDFQNPIVIPPGTNNFTLKGAGSTKTLFTSQTKQLSEFVLVGPTCTAVPVIFVKTEHPCTGTTVGATVVYVPGGVIEVPGHYVDVFDYNQVWANGANVTNIYNHSELSKVLAFNSVTGAVTIDKPLGRTYTNAYITDVSSVACSNITIEGIGFNGLNTTTPTFEFTYAQLTDNYTESDLVGANYTTAGSEALNCRNVTRTACSFTGASNSSNGGYAFFDERSRFVTNNNCYAANAQHGFEGHGGSTDLTYNNCSESSAPFDLHGMDEERVSYNGCTGELSTGNAAWQAGDSGITISNCKFNYFNATAYTSNVQASNSFLGLLQSQSFARGVTPSQASAPTNMYFTNCQFKYTSYLLANDPFGGNLYFSGCSFEATQTAWGEIFAWTDFVGLVVDFENCSFQLDTTASYIPIVLNGIQTVTINNSTITAAGASKYGIQLSTGFTGPYPVLNSDTFTSTNKTRQLLLNLSNVKPTGQN